MTTVASSVRNKAESAKAASRQLARLSSSARAAALLALADLIENETDAVLEANAADIKAATESGIDEYFIERLTLDEERLRGIAAETRTVAALPDPVGEVFDSRTLPNGLLIGRRRVPLGLVACIYESRPNVTVDIASLSLKSGNACILRGGKEAQRSNNALADLIGRALARSEAPPESVQVIREPDRAHVDELLSMNDVIDLMVPRGGAGLLAHVRDNATMPVVAAGVAVVHVYVDEFADLDMAEEIIHNSKTRRFSICNALDTIILHHAIADKMLARLADRWAGQVMLLGDERTMGILAGQPDSLLDARPATPEDWHTELLSMRACVRVVDTMDEALAHIESVDSGHSEAIVTESYPNGMRFLDEVDSAAVYLNASTQFTDGAQFGLGAEIGVSTQKMHARGPMGLKELTSYKWTVFGRGQVRPE
jgi:glutamate-5-semialdehyde dehydrogenase